VGLGGFYFLKFLRYKNKIDEETSKNNLSKGLETKRELDTFALPKSSSSVSLCSKTRKVISSSSGFNDDQMEEKGSALHFQHRMISNVTDRIEERNGQISEIAHYLSEIRKESKESKRRRENTEQSMKIYEKQKLRRDDESLLGVNNISEENDIKVKLLQLQDKEYKALQVTKSAK
jgi:hypothetical protein